MIIGIGGVSRAGKTTLANRLKDRIKGKTITILNQDDFVKNSGLPTIRNHIDWEHPQSMNWKKLLEAIKAADKDHEIVIVEGLFAFYEKKISLLFDHHIFVRIDKALFEDRKKKDIRWGKEPAWFIEHIWQSFLKYGQIPNYQTTTLIVNGTKSFPLDQIISYLNI